MAGETTITVTADNGVAEAEQELRIRVTSLPSFVSPPSATFRELVRGEFVITTSGFPPAALTLTGSLPAGVSFTDNGNGAASLAGTPAAGSAGAYPLTVTASNDSAGAGDQAGGTVAALAVGTISQQLTITVAAVPSPTPTSTTQGPTTEPTDTTDPDTSNTDDNDSSTSTGDLASTGGPSAWVGLGGVLLVAAGGSLWLVSRRRGRHS